MAHRLPLGGLLLLSTALSSPALAQNAQPAQPAEAPTEEKVEVSMSGASLAPEIVVRGRSVSNPARATPQVVAVLSTADIARAGDGDVAGALTRVTGLSVVGGGFVYVRGLGDRYSMALLNGSPLPSPEPLKRVVPLDMFPTNVVASVVVQKSFSPNYPGEFGGGVINLTTKAIPEKPYFEVGFSTSGDTFTTGKVGYTHYGSKWDWTGANWGARDVPKLLQSALTSGSLITPGANFSSAQLQALGMGLNNSATSVVQRNSSLPVNMAGDINWGAVFDVGETRLGVIATMSYSNSWHTREATQQFSGGAKLNPDVSYTAVRSDNQIVLNGMLGVGAEFGRHKVRITNLIIRDTLKLSKLAKGYDALSDSAENSVMKQETAWYEKQLINSQAVAELRFGDVSLDLRGSAASSSRKAPYERSFSYAYDKTVGDYINDLRSVNQSARISFSDLSEKVYSGAIDLAWKVPSATPLSLSAGYAYSDTKRNSSRRDFRFLPDGSLNSAAAQMRPDYLLSDYSIQTNNIFLTETSGQAGAAAFEAGLRVHGAYAQAEVQALDTVRINGGVRFEKGEQYVQPLNLFNSTDLTFLTPTRINKSYWLPALTVTWNVTDKVQWRVAGSKTVARPQFRELARQVYQDTDSDRQFFGNPFLKDSVLYNAETRLEYYMPRGQRMSAAGFYKRIDNPIETFAFIPSGSLVASFANAPKAQLYGVELDAVRNISLESLGQAFSARKLVVSANYTYSKSKIQVGAAETIILPFGVNGEVAQATAYFRNGARMTGQSDHLVNLQLGVESSDKLSQQTLMLTYASDRVTNRGPLGQVDIMERPGVKLDFVAREEVRIARLPVKLKFEARNILGTAHQEYQNDGSKRIDINTYKLGTSFSLGANIAF